MSHADAASLLLDGLMADQDGIEALQKTRAGLRDDRWERGYTDAIGQSARHGADWPIDQLAAFTTVHAMIYSGMVAVVRVGTAGTPLPDREREANAATLSVLPRPFSAAVDLEQSNSPLDGTLAWSEPITVQQATGLTCRRPDGSTTPILAHYEIAPGWMPLEIGSTLPSRTYAHVVWGSGVARWPYGEPRIHLFVSPGPRLADRIGPPAPTVS